MLWMIRHILAQCLLGLGLASSMVAIQSHDVHDIPELISPHRGLKQLQARPPLDCSTTSLLAWNQPYSTATSSKPFESCYTVPFTHEVADTYLNLQTNQTATFTYTFSGVLVGGDNTSCARLPSDGTQLHNLFWRSIGDAQQDVDRLWPATGTFDRPYLPLPLSDVCIDGSSQCITNATSCLPGFPYACPVTCGTCDKTWQLRSSAVIRVLRASLGSCCGPDAECRAAKTRVSEVRWAPPPAGTPAYPPKPPAPLPGLTQGFTCYATPYEAFMAPKSTLAYQSSIEYQACVAVNATLVFEEELVTSASSQVIKSTFYKQGTLVAGMSIMTCASPLTGAQIVSELFNTTWSINGVALTYEPLMMSAYGSRVDGPLPPKDVCYDSYDCYKRDPGLCLNGTLASRCPVMCKRCRRKAQLTRVTLAQIASAALVTCCDTAPTCTDFIAEMHSIPTPTQPTLPLLTPGPSALAPSPPPAISQPPTTSGAPKNSTTLSPPPRGIIIEKQPVVASSSASHTHGRLGLLLGQLVLAWWIALHT